MSDTKFNKLKTFLNSNELEELKYLNSQVENIHESKKSKTDIMNMSLNVLINNWANVNSVVFSELVVMFADINKYSNFVKEDNANSILVAINYLIKDLFSIFTKDGRVLYIGLTLILISILIYFIGITS
jgi:hypothetical protein